MKNNQNSNLAVEVIGFSQKYNSLLTETNNKVDFILPDNVDYKGSKIPIIGIGINAFRSKQIVITSFKVPSSLLGIGDYAFHLVKEIACDLVINAPLCIISECCFYQTNIKGNISLEVHTIGSYAFRENNAQGSLTLKNVVVIKRGAFYENKFQGDLILPDSIEAIEEHAFNMAGFTGRLKLPRNLKFDTINTCVFRLCKFTILDGGIPEGIKTIGSVAFHQNKFQGDLILPDSIEAIEEHAFNMAGFKDGTLRLPKKLTAIKHAAFRNCYFKILDGGIPQNVKVIEEHALLENNFQGDLILPDTIEEIGKSAFNNAGFTGRLKLPRNRLFNTIKHNTFRECHFTSLDGGIPDNVQVIEYLAFYENQKFQGDLILPDSIKEIGEHAFYNAGFTGHLKLPKNIGYENVSGWTFHNCGFSSIEIPNNIKNIGAGSFQNLNNLKGPIIIPKSVKNIEGYGFYLVNNNWLKEVQMYKTTNLAGESALKFNVSNNVIIKYLDDEIIIEDKEEKNDMSSKNNLPLLVGGILLIVATLGVGSFFAWFFLIKKRKGK